MEMEMEMEVQRVFHKRQSHGRCLWGTNKPHWSSGEDFNNVKGTLRNILVCIHQCNLCLVNLNKTPIVIQAKGFKANTTT